MNSRDKVNDFEDFYFKYGLKPEEILYMGDDLPDYKKKRRNYDDGKPEHLNREDTDDDEFKLEEDDKDDDEDDFLNDNPNDFDQ